MSRHAGRRRILRPACLIDAFAHRWVFLLNTIRSLIQTCLSKNYYPQFVVFTEPQTEEYRALLFVRNVSGSRMRLIGVTFGQFGVGIMQQLRSNTNATTR